MNAVRQVTKENFMAALRSLAWGLGVILVAMRFGLAVTLLWLSHAAAQDSSQVLREFVGYRTTLATRTLTAEQKELAVQLQQRAMSAGQLKQFGEAMRHLHHGKAVMQGLEWTPEVQLASSLKLAPEHAIWEPGQKVVLRFDSLFPTDATAAKSIPATAVLEHELGRWANVNAKWSGTIEVPKLAPGKYRLDVKPGAHGAIVKSADVIVEPGLRSQVSALRSRVAALKASPGLALWTAQYLSVLFDRADRNQVNPGQIDWSRELKSAASIVAALEAGTDPFSGRKGDMRQAYLSAVDNSLQPYRLYVPSSYDSAKATPIVIALHGMGGDENTLLDRYGSKVLMEEAEKQGFLLAAPKGREPASMYRESAETDVLDVLAQVRKQYRIDDARIYLIGHSMGAFGTWSIAMNHPDLFAALGAVSGGGNEEGLENIKRIPQYIVHGDSDKTVPVKSSRSMVAAAKELAIPVEYVEIPGGGHGDAFVPSIPKMFEWLAKQRKAVN
ncbi:MAG: PHB depolymerase family esterase [Bryobacteraceae bacterium]